MFHYDINIVVNGSRCKKYTHKGKTFIESKVGTEYSIEIKNNSHVRHLAICSVDGLNIIDGLSASPDSSGYVIEGYSSNKYHGFRISDEEIAKFIFSKKEKSYATSKGDGSEQNVGVIGVKLFDEKPKYTAIRQYLTKTTFTTQFPDNYIGDSPSTMYMRNVGNVGIGTPFPNDIITTCTTSCNTRSAKSDVFPVLDVFDMGTSWGSAKQSKVVEVEFEKNVQVFSQDIYYASRESLIALGVPIDNKTQINFPSSFPNKYATPPKGWRK
jgi:hypothetical protein